VQQSECCIYNKVNCPQNLCQPVHCRPATSNSAPLAFVPLASVPLAITSSRMFDCFFVNIAAAHPGYEHQQPLKTLTNGPMQKSWGQ
jgi:hypothetical protein